MFNLSKYIKLEGDKTIWGVVFFLLGLSVLLVYSIDGVSVIRTHIRNIIIALFVMYFVHKLKFKYFSKLSVVAVVVSIVLLIVVYFIGHEINGAKRWISLGGLSFQPSDLAKIAILIFMARQISKYRDYLHEFKGVFWYLLGPLIFICCLILPYNFSTAALVFFNGLVLMIIGKVHLKFILLIVGFSMAGVVFIYLGGKYVTPFQDFAPRSITWVSRIDGFISPSEDDVKNEGHQLNQAKIAIQNGGVLGKGPGKGVQRHFLYASSSDFIYAIMIEQYGLIIGGIMPIFLYLLFFYRSVIISSKSESVFGSLVVAGLSFALVFQAISNMAVNVGLFPVTGQTLPLISKGGTSIIFTCIAIGIILSISRNTNDRDYEKA